MFKIPLVGIALGVVLYAVCGVLLRGGFSESLKVFPELLRGPIGIAVFIGAHLSILFFIVGVVGLLIALLKKTGSFFKRNNTVK